MRLSISNIAWDVSEDEMIAGLLNNIGIDAIDVAPGKYFPDPLAAADEDIARVKNWWSERGIEIIGMQGLMFGTSGLNAFGSTDIRAAMLQHLAATCRVGAGLGARRLVFGSPRNRDRSGLSHQEAIDLAIPFFQRLGAVAESYGVVICLEPNPPRYGCNFMTTSAEATRLVNEISRRAIRMQLDTGAIAINREDIDYILKNSSGLIGHIHASEPDLLPLGDGKTDHSAACQALMQYLPDHIVSIEMQATKNEPHEVSIRRALNVAIQNYRTKSAGGDK